MSVHAGRGATSPTPTWIRWFVGAALIAAAGLKLFAASEPGCGHAHAAADLHDVVTAAVTGAEVAIGGWLILSASQWAMRAAFMMSLGFAGYTAYSLLTSPDPASCGCLGDVRISVTGRCAVVIGFVLMTLVGLGEGDSRPVAKPLS